MKIKIAKHFWYLIERVRRIEKVKHLIDDCILGKGFLNKDDFLRAFERLNIKLNSEAIDSAFK